MGKFGWIIFLIIVAANVIGPILKKREEHARKKRQSGAAPTARSRPPSPGARPHTTGTGSTRMEQLIARRQAQLEELRGRREQRRAGRSPQVRIGPASTPTTQPSPTVFRAPAPQPTRRVSVTRPTTAPPPSASSPSAVRPARPPQPAQRRRVSKEPVAQRRRGGGLAPLPPGLVSAAAPTPRPAQKRFSLADSGPITPQLLRRIIVLKEILDPPIALRTRDLWDTTC